MKRDRKEPLYRKEKKTGLQTRYYTTTGGEYRWGRHTKKAKEDAEQEVSFQPINGRKDRNRRKNHQKGHGASEGGSGFGRDYTPLYRFLHSKAGKKWDEVYSEAKSRLDREDPIWYIVHRESDKNDWREAGAFSTGVVNLGEGSMWSAMMIDDDGYLQFIDKESKGWSHCTCHTTSFNGKPVDPKMTYQKLQESQANLAS